VKKKITLIIATPLIFILVGVLFTLPAHRQIRSIHPPLPSFDIMAAAVDVADGPVNIRYLNSASQRSPSLTLGHPGVLLEWASGRRFLIDTGMSPTQAVDFGKPMEFLLDAEPTDTYGSLADQLGDSVDSIKGIAFTHLHSDHTGGLPIICAAQAKPATIFQTPLQFNELNYTTKMGFAALEEAACQRRQLAEATIMAIPGFPGVAAISLGGHTPGSTLYLARVNDKLWLFSGDTTNDKKSLLQNLPKPWLYTTFIVPEDTRRTAQLREYLLELDRLDGVTVLPAHDVEAMAKEIPRYNSR
jgi:glyoxylase-like metal-dependent hydrolase (beta-lactamase superfamily II)